MRNKRLTILIITLLLLILLVVITHCFKKRNSVNDIEIISYDNSSINTICQFDDNYYYTINNEIYNNEKCVMSSEGNKLIYANDNAMFVYSNGVITGYGSDFSIISEYPISSEIINFVASNTELIYITPDMNCHVIDLSTGNEEKPIDRFSLSNEIEVLSYQDYKVCKKTNNDSIAIFLNNRLLYSRVKKYAQHFVYLDNEKIVYTSKTNTSTINLYSYSFVNNTITKQADLPTGCGIITFINNNDTLTFIGSEYPTDPSLSLHDANTLLNHKKDCIFSVNIDEFMINTEEYTKKHEKILYADAEKTITYYEGEYLTYSLNDWEVTDKQSANEIKEGGSYNFVSCGEYIFVFDNDSGELLNKISIN